MSAEDSRTLVGNRMDITELFTLLESKDIHYVEDVKALIHENLNSSRETMLLCALLEYCMATQSNRCLEILVRVREPHDKHLFDKLADSLKGADSRESALRLLGHLVRKQPSWLHKIATHKILITLLNLLKTDSNAPTLMEGLLIIVTLLPIIPSLVAPHIDDIFEIFTRLCAWSTKKPGNVPEVYFLHLRVALYALFHRLYAMYPCNFLGFLRWYYGSRDHKGDNLHVFNETIKPMLERVRLHPLLVTASKETELTTARWKNLEPHDIIVQCSKLSLDEIIEGVQESGSTSPWNELMMLESISSLGQQQQSSFHQVNSGRSSEVNVPVEAGSLMADVMEQINAKTASSMLSISDLSPPTQENSNSIHEAEPSLQSKDLEETDLDCTTKMNSQDSCEGSQETSQESIEPTFAAEVVQAEEAKEEGQPPRTSISKECQFLSTTDTLTTNIPFRSDSTPEDPSSQSKEQEAKDLLESSITSSTNEASTVLIERLVHGINRLRFFSHCGHPPDIPIEWLRRAPLLKKSHSWPDLQIQLNVPKESNSSSGDVKQGDSTPPVAAMTTTCSMANIENEIGRKASGSPSPVKTFQVIVPSTSLSSNDFTLPIEEESWEDSSVTVLPDMTASTEDTTLLPLPTIATPLSTNSLQQPQQQQTCLDSQNGSAALLVPPEKPKFALLSPVEVLDRHLQLGSEIYLKELKSMSLASMKDTDWTHFGGPPPADELNILRGQISLLHMQLLFERHRCEVHAERNRRLLGKAKKARALEEQNMAMKDQLGLQEKELIELISKLHELQLKLDQQSVDVDYKNLHNSLRKQMHDNHQLESTNKDILQQLDMQRKECEKLSKSLDESRGSLFEAEFKLKTLREKEMGYGQLEEKVKMFSRRLVVLQELYQRQVEKDTLLPKPPDLSFELHQFKESAIYETEDLKITIKNLSRDLEAYKSRLESSEEQLNAKDLVIAELKDLLESVKSTNADILSSKELHIKTLQRMIQRQEENIMELKHKICIQETTSRPVSSDDGSLSYPLHWHPAQTELSYGLTIIDDGANSDQDEVSSSNVTPGASAATPAPVLYSEVPSSSFANHSVTENLNSTSEKL